MSDTNDPAFAVLTEQMGQMRTDMAEFRGEMKGSVGRIEDTSTTLRINEAVDDEVDRSQTAAIENLDERVEALEKKESGT